VFVVVARIYEAGVHHFMRMCECECVTAHSLCLFSCLFAPTESLLFRLFFINVYKSLVVLLTLLAAPVFVATMCAPTFNVPVDVSAWATVIVPSTVVALEAFPMLTGPSPMVVKAVVVA